MEHFRNALRRRMVLLVMYNIVLIAVVGFGLLLPTAGQSEGAASFMTGFLLGLYAAVQGALVRLAVKYTAALKNKEKLKAEYIYENDERQKFIQAQIGGTGIHIILGGLTIGTIAAGFLNETVFFTLLCALAFSVLVKGALKIHYNRKV